ncbi:MAG: restriction endonuclease, partial [Luteitalea sp.]
QVSHVMADSAWEAHAANVIEQHPHAHAYARNDHLGFQVHYLWNGSRRRYLPDFLVRLRDGSTLVLEIKGQDSDQDRAKRAALDVWVRAVNERGGFGQWTAAVVFDMARMHDVLSPESR